MKIQNLIFLIASIFIMPFAYAGSDYQCTIQKVATADIKPNEILKLNEKLYIGKQFSVERKTGVMIGALKNSYITLPQVIDYGSKNNSYKVITTMLTEQGTGAGSNIYALTINEYTESQKKPFIFLDNDVVFLGTCEHF